MKGGTQRCSLAGILRGADPVSSSSGTGARPWRMREVLQERRSQLGAELGG